MQRSEAGSRSATGGTEPLSYGRVRSDRDRRCDMEKSLEILRASLDWLLLSPNGRLVMVVLVLVYLLAWWRILSRAGFPGALAVLMLVPPFALPIWLFVAFAPWPARRELAALRKVQHVVHAAERRRLIS